MKYIPQTIITIPDTDTMETLYLLWTMGATNLREEASRSCVKSFGVAEVLTLAFERLIFHTRPHIHIYVYVCMYIHMSHTCMYVCDICVFRIHGHILSYCHTPYWDSMIAPKLCDF